MSHQQMAELYGALGEELDGDTRSRMAQWWQDSASERRSGPSPDPTAYGLVTAELREQFAFYHQRFGIGESRGSAG